MYPIVYIVTLPVYLLLLVVFVGVGCRYVVTVGVGRRATVLRCCALLVMVVVLLLVVFVGGVVVVVAGRCCCCCSVPWCDICTLRPVVDAITLLLLVSVAILVAHGIPSVPATLLIVTLQRTCVICGLPSRWHVFAQHDVYS